MLARQEQERKLTDRQREIYTWIYEFTREHGYQPSYRETTLHFDGHSCNLVLGHLIAIAKKGYVRLSRDDVRSSRAIRFLRRPDGTPFTGFADKETDHGNAV